MTTRFISLEITGKCPLKCVHCYAGSSPEGTNGEMQTQDWLRVITEAAVSGVRVMQFIGGEPTTHRDLILMINHALSLAVEVEVFSNLWAISDKLWDVLTQPGLRLATSYYSGIESEHEAITKRKRSYKKTKANIAKAVRLGVQLRVGIVDMLENQDIAGAYQDLLDAGVEPRQIGYDYLREVGRGIRNENAGIEQLCGHCGDSKVAILPSGEVHACVFSRDRKPAGNVLTQPLSDILAGESLAQLRGKLVEAFAERKQPIAQGLRVPKPREPEPDPKPQPQPQPQRPPDPDPCVPSVYCGPPMGVPPDHDPYANLLVLQR